jgi:hypothetical protein
VKRHYRAVWAQEGETYRGGTASPLPLEDDPVSCGDFLDHFNIPPDYRLLGLTRYCSQTTEYANFMLISPDGIIVQLLVWGWDD